MRQLKASHLIVLFAITCALFFARAEIARADESCLKGGNGSCVKLTDYNTAAGGGGQARYMAGDSLSHNVVTLADGTIIAALAKQCTGNCFPTVGFRYEIYLYRSKDGGVTWQNVSITGKGLWYVDQVNATGAAFSGGDKGAAMYDVGFLGYSLAVDESSGSPYFFLVHSVAGVGANSGSDNQAFFCNYANRYQVNALSNCFGQTSGGNGGIADAIVLYDQFHYSSATDTFIQDGTTRFLSSVWSYNWSSGTCSGGVCFGYGQGSFRPNITAALYKTNNGTFELWVTYTSYIGDLCAGQASACKSQNGTNGPGHSGMQLWVRHIQVQQDGTFVAASVATDPNSNNEVNLIKDVTHAAPVAPQSTLNCVGGESTIPLNSVDYLPDGTQNFLTGVPTKTFTYTAVDRVNKRITLQTPLLVADCANFPVLTTINWKTSITSNIAAGANSLTLTSVDGFFTPKGNVLIGSETIHYSSINRSTKVLTLSSNTTVAHTTADTVKFANTSGNLDIRNTFFAQAFVKYSITNPTYIIQYPLILYSYTDVSRRGMTNVTAPQNQLKAAYIPQVFWGGSYSINGNSYPGPGGSWVSDAGPIQALYDASKWANTGGVVPTGNIIGGTDSTMFSAYDSSTLVTPAFAGYYTTDYGGTIYLSAYMNPAVLGGKISALPIILKLKHQMANPPNQTLQSTPLADYASVLGDMASQELAAGSVSQGRVYAEAGGPSITRLVSSTYNGSVSYVALPVAPTAQFDPLNVNIFYTRAALIYNPTLDYDTTDATRPQFRQLSSNDTNAAGPNYYRSITAPVMPTSINAVTNLFHPPLLFSRVVSMDKQNLQSRQGWCDDGGAGSTCSVVFSGEQDTVGIQGWGWASTVGWLSLSCNNLETCYKIKSPYSTTQGGVYYGVRAVTNSQNTQKSLIGKAWSERIGYISFDRQDSMRAGNECGNPPETVNGVPVIANGTCAKLAADISSVDTLFQIVTTNWNLSGLPLVAGYYLIDNEIFKATYTGANFLSVSVVNDRGLSSGTYTTPSREHKAGAGIFYLGTSAPSAGVNDVYRGLSTYNPQSFDIKGWGRVTAWSDYQANYCKDAGGVVNIGPGNTPPCDKEWGWIKLNGTWQSTTIAKCSGATCLTTSPQVDTVDGIPDATVAQPERALFNGTTEGTYTNINRTTRIFTLPSMPVSPITTIQWSARLASAITSSDTSIPVSSIAGLSASGKIVIGTEMISYSQIDTVNKILVGAIRGVANTTIAAHSSGDLVIQKYESGTYATIGLPVADKRPEITLSGYSWSAPNTYNPSNTTTVSPYQNTIAGVGWISLNPSKMTLIYPYLRTLFSDVYVGGNITTPVPDGTLSPKQQISTYLLQSTNGIVSPFPTDTPASTGFSGAYDRCVVLCNSSADIPACITTKCSNLNPQSSPSNQQSTIPLSSQTSVYGKLPSYDKLADMVSDCKNVSGNSVACPTSASQARKISSTNVGLFGTYATTAAVSGINVYGDRVYLCRSNPNESFTDQVYADHFFANNGYNPSQCAWTKSDLWTAKTGIGSTATKVCLVTSSIQFSANIKTSGSITVKLDNGADQTVAYTSKTTGAANTACDPALTELSLSPTSLTNTVSANALVRGSDTTYFLKPTLDATGKKTVFVVPDDYGDPDLTPSGLIRFDSFPMQFNNATKNNNGAITFLVPGDALFMQAPMRYCPQGDLNSPQNIPCVAAEDSTYNSVTNLAGTKIESVNQLASVGWLVKGSVMFSVAAGDLRGDYFKGSKMYSVGAFVLYDDCLTNPTTLTCQISGLHTQFFTGASQSFWDTLSGLASGAQMNLYGFVVASNYVLLGDYYARQGSTGPLNEPADNFVYDGRAIVNPPPGFGDLSTGLPKQSTVTP